jgi:hypothetical protein
LRLWRQVLLRPNIGCELALEQCNLVFKVKLALLETLQLELVLDSALREAGNYVIEVAVLEMQLIDTLPEHFTVGGMYYHGRLPPYRLDEFSIDLKKTKNETMRPRSLRLFRAAFKVLFFLDLNPRVGVSNVAGGGQTWRLC